MGPFGSGLVTFPVGCRVTRKPHQSLIRTELMSLTGGLLILTLVTFLEQLKSSKYFMLLAGP